jgi:hypothetical protein
VGFKKQEEGYLTLSAFWVGLSNKGCNVLSYKAIALTTL